MKKFSQKIGPILVGVLLVSGLNLGMPPRAEAGWFGDKLKAAERFYDKAVERGSRVAEGVFNTLKEVQTAALGTAEKVGDKVVEKFEKDAANLKEKIGDVKNAPKDPGRAAEAAGDLLKHTPAGGVVTAIDRVGDAAQSFAKLVNGDPIPGPVKDKLKEIDNLARDIANQDTQAVKDKLIDALADKVKKSVEDGVAVLGPAVVAKVAGGSSGNSSGRGSSPDSAPKSGPTSGSLPAKPTSGQSQSSSSEVSKFPEPAPAGEKPLPPPTSEAPTSPNTQPGGPSKMSMGSKPLGPSAGIDTTSIVVTRPASTKPGAPTPGTPSMPVEAPPSNPVYPDLPAKPRIDTLRTGVGDPLPKGNPLPPGNLDSPHTQRPISEGPTPLPQPWDPLHHPMPQGNFRPTIQTGLGDIPSSSTGPGTIPVKKAAAADASALPLPKMPQSPAGRSGPMLPQATPDATIGGQVLKGLPKWNSPFPSKTTTGNGKTSQKSPGSSNTGSTSPTDRMGPLDARTTRDPKSGTSGSPSSTTEPAPTPPSPSGNPQPTPTDKTGTGPVGETTQSPGQPTIKVTKAEGDGDNTKKNEDGSTTETNTYVVQIIDQNGSIIGIIIQDQAVTKDKDGNVLAFEVTNTYSNGEVEKEKKYSDGSIETTNSDGSVTTTDKDENVVEQTGPNANSDGPVEEQKTNDNNNEPPPHDEEGHAEGANYGLHDGVGDGGNGGVRPNYISEDGGVVPPRPTMVGPTMVEALPEDTDSPKHPGPTTVSEENSIQSGPTNNAPIGVIVGPRPNWNDGE